MIASLSCSNPSYCQKHKDRIKQRTISKILLTMWCKHATTCQGMLTSNPKVIERMEGSVLFNDAVNTFYLQLYCVRHGKGPFR